jgi:hypothetical protein
MPWGQSGDQGKIQHNLLKMTPGQEKRYPILKNVIQRKATHCLAKQPEEKNLAKIFSLSEQQQKAVEMTVTSINDLVK